MCNTSNALYALVLSKQSSFKVTVWNCSQLTTVHAVRRTGSSRQPDPWQKKPDDHVERLCRGTSSWRRLAERRWRRGSWGNVWDRELALERGRYCYVMKLGAETSSQHVRAIHLISDRCRSATIVGECCDGWTASSIIWNFCTATRCRCDDVMSRVTSELCLVDLHCWHATERTFWTVLKVLINMWSAYILAKYIASSRTFSCTPARP